MAIGQAFRQGGWVDGSSRGRTRVVILAAAISTVGAAIPLAMMLDGILFQNESYKLWTWPAIPAVWLACLCGVALSLRRPTLGPLLLAPAAAAGAWAFEPEHGLFTFGAVWLIAIALYLSRLGVLRDSG